MDRTRRQVLRAGVIGGLTGAGGWLVGPSRVKAASQGPGFRFAQLSDLHLGYRGDANRDVEASLAKVLGELARVTPPPEFVVVTGDLTQATDRAPERTARLKRCRALLEHLGIPFYPLPGEHDAMADRGQAYRAVFDRLYYSFEHRGTKVIALDNVSRGYFLGSRQRAWLAKELIEWPKTAPLIVLSHAPLFDLFPPWNWYTYDGEEVFQRLAPFSRVTMLFGHIHQRWIEHPHRVPSLGGLPTSWPLPEPGPLVRLQPWPQGQTNPYRGLGFRWVDIRADGSMASADVPLGKSPSPEGGLS